MKACHSPTSPSIAHVVLLKRLVDVAITHGRWSDAANRGINEEPLRQLLARFKYRPDWSFKIIEAELHINLIAIDANAQSKNAPIHYRQALPRYVRDDYDWVRWLFEVIRVVETHEMKEFFRIDGVPVFDPHPNG